VEYEEDAAICQSLLRQRLVDVEDLSECARLQVLDKAAGRTPRRLRQLLVEVDALTQTELEEALKDRSGKSESSRLRRRSEAIQAGTKRPSSRLTRLERHTIGPFEVSEKLGSGGMGAIYKARDRITDKVVALKVLNPERKEGIDTERFLREARIACSLAHEGLVRGLSFGNDAGRPFFAMEFIQGESLRARLQRDGAMRPLIALDLTLRVARALEYLHKAGLVHRDIKPENIMLSDDGQVKLCDLGLAREIDLLSTVTQTGQAVGTPRYISPEQAHGKKDIDPKTDIYSLGITVFHMLVGRPPFIDASGIVVLSRHLYDEVPSVRDFDSSIDAGLAILVKRMTHKLREQRPSSGPSWSPPSRPASSASSAAPAATPRPPSAPDAKRSRHLAPRALDLRNHQQRERKHRERKEQRRLRKLMDHGPPRAVGAEDHPDFAVLREVGFALPRLHPAHHGQGPADW
jgi:serine/threonine protein kinase